MGMDKVFPTKEVWVIPEINGKTEETSKLSLGLLSEAASIAQQIGGSSKALIFSDTAEDYRGILTKYGIASTYIFKHPSLRYFSAEAYSATLIERTRIEKPWLILMGDTQVGRELAPRLAVLLGTGIIPGCVKMDLSNLQHPRFYRPIYGGQAYQEVIFRSGTTILVTMDPGVLDVTPSMSIVDTAIQIIEPDIASNMINIQHLEYLPADYHSADLTEADVIVGTGAGAIADDILPLIEELANLVEGSLGATRPVVDEGKLPKERLVGQTGKAVNPQLYLALGISGSSHHLGGIQESKTIVSVNRDPQASIFQNSDAGVVADLRDILPGLIEKIKREKIKG